MEIKINALRPQLHFYFYIKTSIKSIKTDIYNFFINLYTIIEDDD